MINQLKNTLEKISLYDLISTSQVYRDVLYALFKNETIPTNILTSIFCEKLKTIKECDAISFYKSKKLDQELLHEYLALYITPMVDGWEVKRTMVDNGSTINVCSNLFFNSIVREKCRAPSIRRCYF